MIIAWSNGRDVRGAILIIDFFHAKRFVEAYFIQAVRFLVEFYFRNVIKLRIPVIFLCCTNVNEV